MGPDPVAAAVVAGCGSGSSPGSTGPRASRCPGRWSGAEHFERVYADPAADGRSRGAGLSDLFWYWLAPGPQMHQEHLEPGERYRDGRPDDPAGARRAARALRRAGRRPRPGGCSTTLPGRPDQPVRLRDLMMPVWAEVFYELVFGEPCPPRRPRPDRGQRRRRGDRAEVHRPAAHAPPRPADPLPAGPDRRRAPARCVLPAPFTAQETAWYLQGTFFNTAVVQMSEAMAHLLLARGPAPGTRRRDPDDDAALDRVIDETLRVHPLFGIAHRITSAPHRGGRPRSPCPPVRCCSSTTWPTSAPGRPPTTSSTRTAG